MIVKNDRPQTKGLDNEFLPRTKIVHLQPLVDDLTNWRILKIKSN